jgi:hypothetical protein
MKTTLRFDQLSCRLQVEGLPDVSVGQSGEVVGIISGWSLQWAGRPELEGRKQHLLALMQVVLPYARYLLSGVERPFGTNPAQPVEISPHPEGGHQLVLHSSQPDTAPLQLRLDDAELADLVRVLDQLRLDPRLQLALHLPEPKPLKAFELERRTPLGQRLAAPVGGLLALALLAGLGLLLPVPKPQPGGTPGAKTSATPTSLPLTPTKPGS